MLKHLITCIVFICSYQLSAQNKNFINYSVKPMPVGAKQIEVVFEMKLPKPTKSNFSNISGVIDFSLQIVNKKEANNSSIKGKEIAFFIETIKISDQPYKSVFFNIPNTIKLSEKLPDDLVYRLSHKDNMLLLLNPKNSNYEKRISITPKNNILDIGGNEKKSNINISFLNRPTTVIRGTDYKLHAQIHNSNTANNPTCKVKFEIHIVDSKDVYNNNNVGNQKFVCNSGESVNIPVGISNHKFKLQSPEIPSKFLPKGKVYRVRLLNDSLNSSNAYPFPFELTVIKNKFETSIFSEKSQVSISPNPVTDYLIVNSNKKSKSYKIYDISGVLVKEQQNLRRIEVSDLKPGVYLLATDSGVTRFTKK